MALKTVCVLFASVAVLAPGCGQKREPAPRIDPEVAARMGLTKDAVDPTRRDLDAGYYKWKPKPEAEGTLDPTSPGRRKVGGPNP